MKKIYLLSGAILLSVAGFSQTVTGNAQGVNLSPKSLSPSISYDSSIESLNTNEVIDEEVIQLVSQSGEFISIVTIDRPADYENWSAPDSNGIRTFLNSPSAEDERAGVVKLPYPIIFIHGLGSKASTWDIQTNFMQSQYGCVYGGRFDFCLNYDGNKTSSNKNLYPATGADIALFTPSLVAGDYYYINFDVGKNGSVYPATNNVNYVESNQSAITKQGKALGLAIKYVLQKTGRDKVILMGHSMGGLASREYLQNSTNWQPDGKHHVAKLATTGTPHGGSNATSFGLPVSAVDEKSEAIRDLRRSYYNSNDPGVFLFGGYEIHNSTHMNDNVSVLDFWNIDVNSNGSTGNLITGLNQRSTPANVDYSCIVGKCSSCLDGFSPSDGVVRADCAELDHYINFNVNPVFNKFYYNAAGAIQIHTDLPSQKYQNMQGLDEPNEFSLAYSIGLGKTYSGFTTFQPTGGYAKDYDDYKFYVPQNSSIKISITNISLANLSARIVNSAGNTVGTVKNSNGTSSINFTQILNAGNYYLEVFGTPTSTSYLHPYVFNVIKTQPAFITGIELPEKSNNLLIYPNPATDILNITNISGKTALKLYDILGKLVMETEAEGSAVLDVSQLNGIYTLISDNNKGRTTSKVVVTK